PRGEIRLSAARVAPVEGRFKGEWPKIEKIKLHALGDGEEVHLDEFAFTVEEQAVQVSGRIPLKFADWSELRNHPREFAQRGQIRIQIPDAEIAAFDQYFPQYIAPKGRFQVDLTLQGEESVDGFIRLQNGTSRPLGPLGVLQEINADIRFNQRTAVFHGVTAKMGGQAVTLQGRAELPVDAQPQLNLTLTGQNLPFVRRSGLLIRGDLDLQLVTRNGGDPIIRGAVRLRDSLFLADIRSLIPSGTKGVAARPPYFSVDTPPLNMWALDVGVTGEEFLRLRTPVFNGTASAKFRLDGTLGQPRIGGEAIINRGNIRLPFANFEVRQGEVRLSPGQIEPQLFVNATTRRYGYDLRMEISGGTSAPNLVFSSSPPLEAEQVLLMVMAGNAPSNEITSTERQRVARFGAFFGQSLLGSLGGDPTGPDRLTISSGGDISEQGRETYDIEYRLDNRWSLTGEYDEFDDYYGGLKWRIYPKSDKKADNDE
ncbi:MAG TPA: translocation/assembly module TamB domain-containing protein, partial [Opitutus sp.]|nr:translocation/assembly module TamB domain-containing protein [Opitutus sp.]